MKKETGKRGWLRPRRSTGPMSTYQWHVRNGSWSDQPNIDAEFALRDCDATVSFSMWCEERKHVTKHVAVLDLLILQLTECKQALLTMSDEVFK